MGYIWDIYDMIGIEIIPINKTAIILILLFSWGKKEKYLLSILYWVYILCLKYKGEKIKKNRQAIQNEVTGSGCQEISIMVTAVFGCGLFIKNAQGSAKIENLASI